MSRSGRAGPGLPQESRGRSALSRGERLRASVVRGRPSQCYSLRVTPLKGSGLGRAGCPNQVLNENGKCGILDGHVDVLDLNEISKPTLERGAYRVLKRSSEFGAIGFKDEAQE